MGDIGMLKGGLLALLLCGKRLIVNGVVVPGSTVSLGVYQREEGGRNNKYKADKCITMHDMANKRARHALTQYYTSQMGRKNIWRYFMGLGLLPDR